MGQGDRGRISVEGLRDLLADGTRRSIKAGGGGAVDVDPG